MTRQANGRHKASKQKDLVVGKKVAGGLLSWRGADLTTNIYVGNFDVQTTLEEVKTGIEAQDVNVVELEEIKRSHNRFKSFRLRIRKADLSMITNADFWPEGVVVRNFFWGKNSRVNAERISSSPQS